MKGIFVLSVLAAMAFLAASELQATIELAPQEQATFDFCAGFVDCESCVVSFKEPDGNGTACYWCRTTANGTTDACLPVTATLPIELEDQCPNLDFNVGTCTLTARVIVILTGVFGALVLGGSVAGCTACYCFWRHKKAAKSNNKSNNKSNPDDEEPDKEPQQELEMEDIDIAS